MTLLLDSNALLWLLRGDFALGPLARNRIAAEATLVVSDVSLLEISIKASSKKLDLPPRLTALIEELGIRTTRIQDAHLDAMRKLPFHHKDPFDRYLIAQALVDSTPVMTSDGAFAQYGVAVVDARL